MYPSWIGASEYENKGATNSIATEAQRHSYRTGRHGEDSWVGVTGKGPLTAKKEARSGRPWGTVASVFLRSKAKVSEWWIFGVERLLRAANGSASRAAVDGISTKGEAKKRRPTQHPHPETHGDAAPIQDTSRPPAGKVSASCGGRVERIPITIPRVLWESSGTVYTGW